MAVASDEVCNRLGAGAALPLGGKKKTTQTLCAAVSLGGCWGLLQPRCARALLCLELPA